MSATALVKSSGESPLMSRVLDDQWKAPGPQLFALASLTYAMRLRPEEHDRDRQASRQHRRTETRAWKQRRHVRMDECARRFTARREGPGLFVRCGAAGQARV